MKIQNNKKLFHLFVDTLQEFDGNLDMHFRMKIIAEEENSAYNVIVKYIFTNHIKDTIQRDVSGKKWSHLIALYKWGGTEIFSEICTPKSSETPLKF